MKHSGGRYRMGRMMNAAPGWEIERLTPPSRLYGANGICAGPDGRIYVAQVSGSQISAVDPATGAIEAISALGGDIVAPDDVVFDDAGNLYATEITEGRVAVRRPNGKVDVLFGDLPAANPITIHQGELIAGECRVDGRVLALDRNGDVLRTILSGVPMANAFEVGPDGMLYLPIMATNEIWRVDLAGGEPEVVVGNLGVPTALKFDAHGFIISTQGATGQVLRIHPQTRDVQILAQLDPGLDNLCFLGDRLYVSNMIGSVTEINVGGNANDLVAGGMNWPLGLALGDDELYVADGAFCYFLKSSGERRIAGGLFSPGYPGYVRGVVREGCDTFLVTTGVGDVVRFRPRAQTSEVLANGFEQLYGIVKGNDEDIFVADKARGSVQVVRGGVTELLADGLDQPKGLAHDAGGRLFVAETGAGQIKEITAQGADIVLDGLDSPEGLVVSDGNLFIVEAGRKQVLSLDLDCNQVTAVAVDLPVGAPAGVTPKFIGPIGTMSGPMGSFAAITADSDGSLYLSGDAEGSVLILRPT